MKTLIAVAVVALSVLSFQAQALSRENVLETAAAYKDEKGSPVKQAFFLGTVSMGIGLVTNCIPPKTPLGNIADKAATFILYDQKVNAMYDASYMVLEAIKRTYPCVKS